MTDYSNPIRIAAWLVVAAALLLAGCNPPPVKQGATEMSIPADFAIQLRVHGKPGAKEVSQQTVDYVVEPNRAFHVAGGSWGSQGRVFPPLLRHLDYQEFNSLFRIVAGNNLTVEPSSPNGEAAANGKSPGTVWYEVVICSGGRTHKYSTTGEESPPTSQLLGRLHELRTGRKLGASPAATQPAGAPTVAAPSTSAVPAAPSN